MWQELTGGWPRASQGLDVMAMDPLGQGYDMGLHIASSQAGRWDLYGVPGCRAENHWTWINNCKPNRDVGIKLTKSPLKALPKSIKLAFVTFSSNRIFPGWKSLWLNPVLVWKSVTAATARLTAFLTIAKHFVLFPLVKLNAHVSESCFPSTCFVMSHSAWMSLLQFVSSPVAMTRPAWGTALVSARHTWSCVCAFIPLW